MNVRHEIVRDRYRAGGRLRGVDLYVHEYGQREKNINAFENAPEGGGGSWGSFVRTGVPRS